MAYEEIVVTGSVAQGRFSSRESFVEGTVVHSQTLYPEFQRVSDVGHEVTA